MCSVGWEGGLSPLYYKTCCSVPISSTPSFSQIYLHIIFPLFLKTNATAPSRASQLLIYYSKPYLRLNVWGSRKLLYPSHRKYFSFRSPPPTLWKFHSNGPTLPRIISPIIISVSVPPGGTSLAVIFDKANDCICQEASYSGVPVAQRQKFSSYHVWLRLATAINHLGQETGLLTTQFCFSKWWMWNCNQWLYL